jgi:hypothetical protein
VSIDEKNRGPNHPNVAIRLDNLAGLLLDTNRLSDTELLYPRPPAINEREYCPDHPTASVRRHSGSASA